MANAAQVREQVEAALAGKGGARLRLEPRLVCPGFDTGYATLDAILQGGLPVAGTSELIGSRSSGRVTFASAYIARRTREGHVCAWVDVGGDMDPQAALANGMDAARVLWVRCGCNEKPEPKAEVKLPTTKVVRPVPPRDKTIGTPGVRNRVLGSAERVEQLNSDRQPARRGDRVVQAAAERAPVQERVAGPQASFAKAKKPWNRMEQAIRAVDLLVQGGGFGAIVLDLGSIEPQYARRIPLATWFRWRAALERTRTSLLVLSQSSLTGSSAELVLRVEAEMPAEGTVMTGVTHRLEVVRRRFAEQTVAAGKKGPGRSAAATATTWESKAIWA